MFVPPPIVRRELGRYCRALDPDRLDGAEAAEAIDELTKIEKLAAGARVRLAKRVDATVTGSEGEEAKADWLAKATGQSPAEARKDLEASEQLGQLEATDEAVKNGELSPTQAREVASAATEDPDAEPELLDIARNGSVPELRRKSKRVRAAATDDAEKNRKAHENRRLCGGVDEDTAEGWLHGTGPAARLGEFWAHLEPWIQAQFDQARRQGRHESRGAYAFDALMAVLAYAAAARRGGGGPDQGGAPAGPPVSILARVDAAAMARGHTQAGETCEIAGLGPVPVAALLDLLPQAAIDLIVTNGIDAWNITHLGRRATARQQVVLGWLGIECTRQGCGATRHLQVDHRVDWATVKVTELTNLDWLCGPCHHRKTHQHWALIDGTGIRPMVPPDHPHHPHNRRTTGPDPPRTDAA